MKLFSGAGLVFSVIVAGGVYAPVVFAQTGAATVPASPSGGQAIYSNTLQAPMQPANPPPSPDLGMMGSEPLLHGGFSPALPSGANSAPATAPALTINQGNKMPAGANVGANTTVKKPSRDDMVYRINLGRADDVVLLIKQGISPDEMNSSGVPVIALAASRSDNEGLEIIKVLLAAGADINKADKRGQNALFYAAKIGNKEVVKYLLEQNIRYTALDSGGNNARIIAYQTGHNEIIEILDSFVMKQNNDVRQKYSQVNQELQERYNAYNTAIKEQIERNNAAIEKQKNDRTQELVHDLSLASCAASYWQFCASKKQPTELGDANLINNIRSQNSRVKDFTRLLVSEQKIAYKNVQAVTASTGEQITKKLLEYKTNDERAEQGIGTIDDMKTRCGIIADSWSAEEVNAPEMSINRSLQFKATTDNPVPAPNAPSPDNVFPDIEVPGVALPQN